jgi:ABC-2 type transport system permease protein
MFTEIFLFEISTQFRRPAVYLYFLVAFLFMLVTFATGSVPLGVKEHINAPFVIALAGAGMSMLLALVGSAVMGLPLYRDIEFGTSDYYLSYPITRAGYFWGRYTGAFCCMLFIAAAIPAGAYLGTQAGPWMGWRDAGQYGPDKVMYYLQPFFVIILPNLFFTSSLFFALVVLTRNIKVIYSGGILLYLGYFISFFFFLNGGNGTVVNLADPFAINGIQLQNSHATAIQKNTSLIAFTGTFLLNRIIWTTTGVLILLLAYGRFRFERFFNTKNRKVMLSDELRKSATPLMTTAQPRFDNAYHWRTICSMVKVELFNLVRDNYFWVILSSGVVFLILSFYMGHARYSVPELPRTVMLFSIFNEAFPFYIFILILFYTGEVLHRERIQGYAVIYDALPPPNWTLYGSKLLALLILGISLALIPMVSAIAVQLAKGFYQFNFPMYGTQLLIILLPQFLAMVVYSFVVHVLVNRKFAAHSIGLFVWLGVFFLRKSGTFNYHLLLYSYTPSYTVSDMDGLGHMLRPVGWFNVYWFLFSILLVIVSALFFVRGITSSFRDRIRLVPERFTFPTKVFTMVCAVLFLGIGSFIYYNVSYLNNYLTNREQTARKALYEKTLKRYAHLPLPKVTSIVLQANLYPDKQQALVEARVTIVNKTTQLISQLLLDGDELTDYTISSNGKRIPYTYPLNYHRGIFNWCRPAREPAKFRLYQFERALDPGDSLILDVKSATSYMGFENDFYAPDLLHNGAFFAGGLPGLGYDENDEISDPFERKRYHLPPRNNRDEIPQDDPVGISTLKAGASSDLLRLDITVSTSGDQVALAPGKLQEQWQHNGRNYFHYVQQQPGMYAPFAIFSARYAVLHDTIHSDHPVNIDIYYHPPHEQNINRFMAAYKDGLHYFETAYGRYPFTDIRLAETNLYHSSITSMTTLGGYPEDFAWNAGLDNPDQFDYAYFRTVRGLAQQWWRFQVAPNSTVGSLMISEGLSLYSALMLEEKRCGKNNMKNILLDQLGDYYSQRIRLEKPEHPLLTMNQPFEENKAGVVLYGLKNLIGEDTMHAALRDFISQYAFRTMPPFAGSNDLYRVLRQHVPDSLKYYLDDTWLRITLYDNRVLEARATQIGATKAYLVTIKVEINKVYKDSLGIESPATELNDYLDIGVFASPEEDDKRAREDAPLYLKKHRLGAGIHTLTVVVPRKPAYVDIDPYAVLIDRSPGDNRKSIDAP